MKIFLKSIVFLLLITMVGCVDEERRESLKQELIDEGVEKFKKERTRRCFNEALLEADRIVDSMMLDKAAYSKIDSFLKPERPIKPEMPPVKDLQRQLPIGPVLDIKDL